MSFFKAFFYFLKKKIILLKLDNSQKRSLFGLKNEPLKIVRSIILIIKSKHVILFDYSLFIDNQYFAHQIIIYTNN